MSTESFTPLGRQFIRGLSKSALKEWREIIDAEYQQAGNGELSAAIRSFRRYMYHVYAKTPQPLDPAAFRRNPEWSEETRYVYSSMVVAVCSKLWAERKAGRGDHAIECPPEIMEHIVSDTLYMQSVLRELIGSRPPLEECSSVPTATAYSDIQADYPNGIPFTITVDNEKVVINVKFTKDQTMRLYGNLGFLLRKKTRDELQVLYDEHASLEKRYTRDASRQYKIGHRDNAVHWARVAIISKIIRSTLECAINGMEPRAEITDSHIGICAYCACDMTDPTKCTNPHTEYHILQFQPRKCDQCNRPTSGTRCIALNGQMAHVLCTKKTDCKPAYGLVCVWHECSCPE